MERLAGDPTRGLTLPGLGEAGLGDTRVDSLVSELFLVRGAFSTGCRYRDFTIVPPDFVLFPFPLLLPLGLLVFPVPLLLLLLFSITALELFESPRVRF